MGLARVFLTLTTVAVSVVRNTGPDMIIIVLQCRIVCQSWQGLMLFDVLH